MTDKQFFSILPQIARKGIIPSLQAMVLSAPGPMRLWFASIPVIVVTDAASVQYILRDNVKHFRKPDLFYGAAKISLGNGLIISEGDLWLKQRRLIQPYLHRKALENISQTMVDTIAKVMQTWTNIEAQSQDAGSLMAQISMAVIMNTLFGTDALNLTERKEVAEAINVIVDYTATRGYLFFWPKEWPVMGETAFHKAYQAVYEAVSRLIRLRREEGSEQDNLIGMLLHAVDAETNEPMSEAQLFDEAKTIFLAGHESTVTAMTWYWYLMGQNPEIYTALKEEVDTVLQGEAPRFEHFPQLKLCQMTYMEALRLYPPFPIAPREATTDEQIGEYKLQKGDKTLVFFYGVHHNPELWPNPEVFDPYRFSPEQEQKRSRFAFVPFSAGPRGCVGNEFAMMQAVWMIAMITQAYEITVVEGQRVVPRVRATLHPANGLKIRLHKRQ